MRTPARVNLSGYKHQTPLALPERWAGLQMGPSAIPYYNIVPHDDVAGSRPTVTTFQRTAGTWSVAALAGQWAYIYDSGAADGKRDAGAWYRITTNTADTLTLETSVTPGVDTVIVSAYNPISETFAHGESASGAYSGCCYDGRYIWMAPRYADDILKLDTLTKDYEKIPHGQGSQAFEGCVFDGQHIWMVPREGDNYFKIDKDDHTITTWAHGLGSNVFSGAVFDGTHIWFSPRQAPLVRLNPSTMETTEYALPGAPADYKTVGCNWDGLHVWIVPDGATPYIYKIDPSNPDDIETIAKPDPDYGYSNSIFDGTWLWLIPFLTADTPLTRIAVDSNRIETIDLGDTYIHHHHDGCFDGESLWLTPYNSADIVRVNPGTGAIQKFPHGQGISAFAGCLFDGRSIWWIPYQADNVVRTFPPRFGTSRQWDQDTITVVSASAAGTHVISMPRDTVRVIASDGGDGTILQLSVSDKTRPRRIMIENDTANTITINLNPDGGGADTTDITNGNAIVLYWSNATTGLYKWGSLN